VAGGFGPGLVDEELDLLDLALDLEGLGRQARGELGRRGRRIGSVEWRLGRGCRLVAGFGGDLSPPAS
jgi:hypothetical protein